MDETYPKEFLEYLMEMCDRIDRGEEKVYPLDEDFFDRLKELTDYEDTSETGTPEDTEES